jgi:hypothetical protein
MERNAWSGWVGFAGWLMIITGVIDAFEGLIAIIREHYYVFGSNQVVIFNVKTWGWIALIWGILLILTGFGLLSGASWARFVAIVIASLAIILQLGFLGSSPYFLWTLTVIGLMAIVLYALIVRWHEATGTR